MFFFHMRKKRDMDLVYKIFDSWRHGIDEINESVYHNGNPKDCAKNVYF